MGLLETDDYNVAIIDKNLPGAEETVEGGMFLLDYIKKYKPTTEVILTTGYASLESAVVAMKKGAFDYMIKPFDMDDLNRKIEKILNFQTFLSPMKSIRIYKALHHEIFKLVAGSKELPDKEMEDRLTILNAKLDQLFNAQRNWEEIIAKQSNALGRISAHASRLRDRLDPGGPEYHLVEQICKEVDELI